MQSLGIPIPVLFCLGLMVVGGERSQAIEPPRDREPAPKKPTDNGPEISDTTFKKIKEGIDRLTERDVLDLLGPADRIVKEDGELTLFWEDTNHIYVDFHRGVAKSFSAAFSRRFPSKAINRAALDKLKTGMTEKEIKAVLGTLNNRIPRDIDEVNVGCSWFDVNRIQVGIKKGKVAECEHTKPNN